MVKNQGQLEYGQEPGCDQELDHSPNWRMKVDTVATNFAGRGMGHKRSSFHNKCAIHVWRARPLSAGWRSIVRSQNMVPEHGPEFRTGF